MRVIEHAEDEDAVGRRRENEVAVIELAEDEIHDLKLEGVQEKGTHVQTCLD